MAQLTTKDGISCDLCHMKLKSKFRYYSYDLCSVNIINGMGPSVLKANRKAAIGSLDLCGNCHGKFAQKVIGTNVILQQKKRRGRADCEISGEPIVNGPAFLVFVTAVEVDLETKAVATDPNYLSFLIHPQFKPEFEPKPVPPGASSWETES